MKYATLMEAQMGEYPDSVVLTDRQMLDLLRTAKPDWLKDAKGHWTEHELEVERERAQWARGAFSCRIDNPDGFFYACGRREDGTYRHVGFRYGTQDSEYVSGFCGMNYTTKGETK